jgi:uncharacterized protein GlcG (DUF336 family)
MAEISANKARTIIRKAMALGTEKGLKALSVVVLDSGGHGKAYGSVMLGMAGTAQMARAEQQAYFMAAVNGVFGGQVVPVPGGVLVRDKRGNVIGAVGVTGDTSDNDVIAAMTGIEAAGLQGEA